MRESEPSLPSEASPLLPDQVSLEHAPENEVKGRPWLVISSLAFSICCLAGSGALIGVPLLRSLEGILCRKHYESFQEGDNVLDERMCKIAPIQSEVAWLNGALDSIAAIVGMVVSLPHGALADRIGRRPVYALSSIGSFLSLVWTLVVLKFWQFIPIRLILFAPLFQIIGGGDAVMSAMIYSIAADVAPAAARANVFLRLAVSSYIGVFLGSIAAARMMQVLTPFAPLLLGLTFIPLGTSVIVFIPETLQSSKIPVRGGGCHLASHSAERDGPRRTLRERMKIHGKHCLHRFKDSVSVLRSPPVTLVLFAFLLAAPINLAAGQFLAQYVSQRFDWSFAQAGYLPSIRGVMDLFVLLLLLPALTKLLLSPAMPFRFSPGRKDLVLARASAFLFMAGALLMACNSISAVISGEIVLTLGDGLVSLCRSLVTTFVDAEHASTLYTIIGVIETAGAWCAGPAIAGLYSRGMQLGGNWLGLPYFGLSGLCALTLVLLGFVSLRNKDGEGSSSIETS